MVKIQFDLPKDVDKYLKIQKAIRSAITKGETIILILREQMNKPKRKK